MLNCLDGSWVAPGDLLAVTIRDHRDRPWLLASFHGDSNGLSTGPLLAALHELACGALAGHAVVLGIDANTYSESNDPYYQSVAGFTRHIRALGLVSVWGPEPDPAVRTTCSSRTFLQTQFSKATDFDSRSSGTGARRYREGEVFPSLQFPSDHAIVSTLLRFRAGLGALAPGPPLAPDAGSQHLSVEEEVGRLCEQQLMQSVSCPGGELDAKNLLFSTSEERSIWIMFSARPMSMAMCKRWMQLMLVLAGLIFVFVGVLKSYAAVNLPWKSAKAFRFIPTMLRNGLQNIDEPQIAEPGLLRNDRFQRFRRFEYDV